MDDGIYTINAGIINLSAEVKWDRKGAKKRFSCITRAFFRAISA
jgi:hypothetical protein